MPPPEHTTDDWLFELVAATSPSKVLTLRVASGPAGAAGRGVAWGCNVNLGPDVTKVRGGGRSGCCWGTVALGSMLTACTCGQVASLAPYHNHGTIALLEREGGAEGETHSALVCWLFRPARPTLELIR